MKGTAAVANVVVQAPEEATGEATKNENKPEPSETNGKNTAEAPKTSVINVGDEVIEVTKSPKKGWWRRG